MFRNLIAVGVVLSALSFVGVANAADSYAGGVGCVLPKEESKPVVAKASDFIDFGVVEDGTQLKRTIVLGYDFKLPLDQKCEENLSMALELDASNPVTEGAIRDVKIAFANGSTRNEVKDSKGTVTLEITSTADASKVPNGGVASFAYIIDFNVNTSVNPTIGSLNNTTGEYKL